MPLATVKQLISNLLEVSELQATWQIMPILDTRAWSRAYSSGQARVHDKTVP